MPSETDPRPWAEAITRCAAAIFDFDETLIDLEAQHVTAYEELCRELGREYDEVPASLRGAAGTRIVDDLHRMRELFGWSASADELLAIRNRHFADACARAELTLMPGVEETVRALHARGKRLAVTSSAVRRDIETILVRFGLRQLFAQIVDGSDVTRGKPDPEAYLVTAAKLGVAPRECVVFEDATAGVRAAKAAGMYCIAVRNPRAPTVQDLREADVVIGSLVELKIEN
jgi:HAD superfamily hydrolase (TIGR01509 family)